MYLNDALQNVNVVCINLSNRKDRKIRAKLQFKNNNINYHMFTVKPHVNSKRGCLESHLNIIKQYINKTNYLFICEDDVKFIRPLLPFPDPPYNWDMLYLGGTVHNNMGNYDDNWVRIATWTCHAYIINLKNKNLINDILKAWESDKEIDEYYIKNIHYKYNCFMLNPMRAIQRDGYSDIENSKVSYDFMEDTLKGFLQPEFEKLVNDKLALKLDFIPPELLPSVSIITPTYNRRKLFPIAIRNFLGFKYPPNKLEWIIVDDSSNDDLSVDDIIPRDKRVKYIPVKANEHLSVAHKRNIAVNEAKFDYIVHMDDDDFYFEGSVMIRIKLLLQYANKGIACVGCSKVGIYDIINNKSSIATDGIISLSEASMAYTKDFWKKQQFNELEKEGEYKSFIQGRFDKILDIPYSYVLIAFFHNNNFTGTAKRIDKNVLINKNTNEEMNFYETFDDETKYIIDYIKNTL